MIQTGSLAIGIVLVIVTLSWLVKRLLGGGDSPATDERQSYERHREAQGREPPVDLGDVCEIAIEEFSMHHSGERRAVGKIEGFVVFVEDVPDGVDVTDVIRIKILSFNRGHTSASATFVERV